MTDVSGPHSVSVILPVGSLDEHRHRALDWVVDQYAIEFPSWQLVAGECEGEWCKARAVADGLEQATAEILVINDADSWCPTVGRAAELVARGHRWVQPHSHVERLSPKSTNELYATGVPGTELIRRRYPGRPGGGIVVLTRAAYELAPLDPRMVGWGHEDDCWGWALMAIVGQPTQLDGTLTHLWHPPAEHYGPGSPVNLELRLRYERAHSGPNKAKNLRALLGEFQCV